MDPRTGMTPRVPHSFIIMYVFRNQETAWWMTGDIFSISSFTWFRNHMFTSNWTSLGHSSMNYTGLSSSTQPLQQTSSVWKYILPCSFSNAASLPSPLRLVGPDSQNSRRYLRGGGGDVHSSPVQVFGRSWGVPVAVAIGGGIRGCLELEAGGGGGRGGGAIVLFCTY